MVALSSSFDELPSSSAVPVGIAQMVISRDPRETLAAYGLGSCVGIAVYDPTAHVAGMLHILLPEPAGAITEANKLRFAKTGIPLFIKAVENNGGMRSRMRIVAAGGALTLGKLSVMGPAGPIGKRNSDAVTLALQEEGLKLDTFDFGGSAGRTLTLATATGKVFCRSVGSVPKEL